MKEKTQFFSIKITIPLAVCVVCVCINLNYSWKYETSVIFRRRSLSICERGGIFIYQWINIIPVAVRHRVIFDCVRVRVCFSCFFCALTFYLHCNYTRRRRRRKLRKSPTIIHVFNFLLSAHAHWESSKKNFILQSDGVVHMWMFAYVYCQCVKWQLKWCNYCVSIWREREKWMCLSAQTVCVLLLLLRFLKNYAHIAHGLLFFFHCDRLLVHSIRIANYIHCSCWSDLNMDFIRFYNS